MVVWADDADAPFAPPPASAGLSGATLPPVPRKSLAPCAAAYASVLAAHTDCVAPGVALREIRAPHTEHSPLSPDQLPEDLPPPSPPSEPGPSMRQTLRKRRSPTGFLPKAVPLDSLWTINRLAFRAGTFFPLFPEGPHVGLVRPYWLVHGVDGLARGLWYYHPPDDRWTFVRPGDFRADAAYLCLEQSLCGQAGAVCIMVANLRPVMTAAGPDAYRLAHVEAGIAGQRACLAAHALGLGATGIGAFYDDDVAKFLHLQDAGWEAIYALALGVPDAAVAPAKPFQTGRLIDPAAGR
jgi:SagB-type dehydrogenase family enzyme